MKYFILLLYNSISGINKMDAADTMTKVTWYTAPLTPTYRAAKAMYSYPSSAQPSGLTSQLIIDTSPLPRPPEHILWRHSQTEPNPQSDKIYIYRVLDLADLNKDKHTTGYAILVNTHTNKWTYIFIQDLEAQFKLDQSIGTGFKLTFTYVDPPPPAVGGKSLYFKTKSTRKSSRRKYFKRKSSKRRIRTKSKYRRQ